MARQSNNLRAIPGVDTLLEAVTDCPLPRPLVVAAIRAELRSLRKAGSIPSPDKITATIRQRLDDLALSRLQPVINGTGVVVHTNLGRSPMNPLATTGFVNLEMDLVTGRRGARAAYLERCLAELCGAEAAMVVNNCAAALVLNLRHFTADKKEVIVSRGELVQIGGGFRLPDILESSGAKLREIGATNHTSMDDYAGAIGPQTGLILKVHRSNFFMKGFVAAPERRELAVLARKKRVPFMEDLGSGVLTGRYKSEDRVDNDAAVEADGTRRSQVVKTSLSDRNLAIVSEVEKVSKELEASPSQVALRWLMQRPGRPLPVIGARTAEQLEDNLGAATISLSEDQMTRLNDISAIELGYPHDIFQRTQFMRGYVDGGHDLEGGWEVDYRST